MNWILSAYREALKARAKDEVPVGAVLVLNGKIIARAHNLREQRQSALAHAEILCIEKAQKKLKTWRLEDCELYVSLEPCVMCAGALQQARIGKVYYGAKDPKAGVVSLGIPIHDNARLNHRFEMLHAEHVDSGTILTEFFRLKRQKLPKN